MERRKAHLYAFLLFLPTVYGFGEMFYLLILPFLLYFERREIQKQVDLVRNKQVGKFFWVILTLLLLILALSFGNKLINGNDYYCVKDFYSSFYLFPATIFVAFFLVREKVFKALIALICLEIVFACLEYFVGVRSFFISSSVAKNIIHNRDLLYDSRTFGLSFNSSVFAYKVLAGLLLLELVNYGSKVKIILRGILILGLLLSFNRSVVYVVAVYWAIQLIRLSVLRLKSASWNGERGHYLLLLGIGLSLTLFNQEFVRQMTRGGGQVEDVNAAVFTINPLAKGGEKGTVVLEDDEDKPYVLSCREYQAADLMSVEDINNPIVEGMIHSLDSIGTSGRKILWFNYLAYIFDNPWVGNGSDKIYFRSWQPNKKHYHLLHAHNSYLQIVATNGFVIAFLYGLFYLLQIRKQNCLPILIILLYSAGQYGVFWGMSFMDVMLVAMLFYPARKLNNEFSK